MLNRHSFRPSIIIILIILVISSQYLLLGPIIGQGFTHEDYVGFLSAIISKENIFSDPIGTWMKIGPHDASHDFYIAILNAFFGENYKMYLTVSIFLKILATLTIYPLILVLSKNKLLAFLTTLLYGISYSSTGALSLYVVGNEYLGVIFMNLFLITYYFCIRKNKIWLLFLSSVLINFSYLISPARIFPIFGIIILIELFIVLKNQFHGVFASLLRSIILIVPIYLVLFTNFNKLTNDIYTFRGLPIFFKHITDGNWYLLLNPLWGLAYLFLPGSYFHFFGQIDISSFTSYFISPFHIVSLVIALLLSFSLSQKPFKFFLIFMVINLSIKAVIFLLLTHHFNLAPSLTVEYNPIVFLLGQYSGILAGSIISLSLTCGIEWYLSGRTNQLLHCFFLYK